MGFKLHTSQKAVAQDALARRFGLSSKALTPAVRAALEALEAENASLRARLCDAEALAERDGLTGALNRRGFMRVLHRTASFVERYKSQAGVVFLDLDGFKAINDGYGHALGDKVLLHVARLLMGNVRDSDSVGRLGGDEFGVVLARVSPEEAVQKAAALSRLISETPFVYGNTVHQLAASYGLKLLEPMEDPEAALARADEAMYADKHARKLRGVLATPDA
ncbi:MAG: GGDEF domain-containing protein [Caulobacterales bacterium]